MPALLIRMSMGPSSEWVCATAKGAKEGSVTSPAMLMATCFRAALWLFGSVASYMLVGSVYFSLMVAARASISDLVRAIQDIRAPAAANARADNLPIPLPAPVIKTTFPFSLFRYLEGSMNGYVFE